MEGLVPFVIHAIKSHRIRRSYRCLSLSEGNSERNQLQPQQQDQEEEGSSSSSSSSQRHRRTRSEFFTASSHGIAITEAPPSSSMDRRLPAEAPSRSRSLRADPWKINRARY